MHTRCRCSSQQLRQWTRQCIWSGERDTRSNSRGCCIDRYFNIPGNFALLCTQGASTLITDIVEEREIEPDVQPEEVRRFQIGRCDKCFRLLDRAFEAMRLPDQYDILELASDYMQNGIDFLLAFQIEGVVDEA